MNDIGIDQLKNVSLSLGHCSIILMNNTLLLKKKSIFTFLNGFIIFKAQL